MVLLLALKSLAGKDYYCTVILLKLFKKLSSFELYLLQSLGRWKWSIPRVFLGSKAGINQH